ncbi:unnamed protein product [Durusdinium trenchii]|uniref:Uncharacterized protein n=1 Tax=Durusdinium trenchii TaxID=1381693 RepID=A0ABP0MGG1_9DINO
MPELLDQLKELPPELLEALQMRMGEAALQPPPERAAPSVKDVRKAAEEQAPAIYSEVLASYCHPDAICHYDNLPEEERGKLLKALRITVEENFQHITHQLMIQGLSNKVSARASEQVRDSPLVRALRLVNKSEVLQLEAIEAVTASLGNWGRKMPRDIHVMQHMMSYKDHLSNFERGNDGSFKMLRTLQTNSTLIKPEAATGEPRNWHQLQPVAINALRLFGVASGKVLVGKLLVPPMVTVGITTLLQDEWGGGGVSGHQAQELAEKRFPTGATLRIAEPFLKIFRDGKQGIRVDSPHDIRIAASGSVQDLSQCRESGNELYKMGQFEAALAEYWQGLHTCEEVAVLLSNRAQAHLKQKCWAEALGDSVLALEGLGFPDLAQRARSAFSNVTGPAEQLVQKTRAVVQITLKVHRTSVRSEESTTNHASLKEKGNMAFRQGHYSEAAAFYTKSLEGHPAAEEVANLLRNVALSSIRAGLLHDALAAAAASLRLQFHSKAVYHLAHALALLGELDLSEEVLENTETLTTLTQLAKEVATTKEYIRGKYSKDLAAAAGAKHFWPGKFIVDWASDAIAVERVEGKGRGLRSLRHIDFGDTLILQRPRGSVSTDATSELLTSTNTDSGR